MGVEYYSYFSSSLSPFINFQNILNQASGGVKKSTTTNANTNQGIKTKYQNNAITTLLLQQQQQQQQQNKDKLPNSTKIYNSQTDFESNNININNNTTSNINNSNLLNNTNTIYDNNEIYYINKNTLFSQCQMPILDSNGNMISFIKERPDDDNNSNKTINPITKETTKKMTTNVSKYNFNTNNQPQQKKYIYTENKNKMTNLSNINNINNNNSNNNNNYNNNNYNGYYRSLHQYINFNNECEATFNAVQEKDEISMAYEKQQSNNNANYGVNRSMNSCQFMKQQQHEQEKLNYYQFLKQQEEAIAAANHLLLMKQQQQQLQQQQQEKNYLHYFESQQAHQLQSQPQLQQSQLQPQSLQLQSQKQGNDFTNTSNLPMSYQIMANHQLNPKFQSQYKLKEELGSGGFGFVFVAEEIKSGKEVAVKFIFKDKIPSCSWVLDNQSGFVPMECYIMKKLNHPNIVSFIDCFDDPKFFYIVMELHGTSWSTKETTYPSIQSSKTLINNALLPLSSSSSSPTSSSSPSSPCSNYSTSSTLYSNGSNSDEFDINALTELVDENANATIKKNVNIFPPTPSNLTTNEVSNTNVNTSNSTNTNSNLNNNNYNSNTILNSNLNSHENLSSFNNNNYNSNINNHNNNNNNNNINNNSNYNNNINNNNNTSKNIINTTTSNITTTTTTTKPLYSKKSKGNLKMNKQFQKQQKQQQRFTLKSRSSMDLFECIESRTKTFTECQSRYIFKQIVYAVNYLYSNGIVHRDLKDENILIDQYLNIKLTDFGAASYIRNYSKGGYYINKFLGTLAYAPPEILRGEQFGTIAQEVFSLGIILFLLVFGEIPFKNPNETLYYYSTNIYNYIPKGKTCSLEVFDLIKWMLQPRPENRPSLEAILNHSWLNKE